MSHFPIKLNVSTYGVFGYNKYKQLYIWSICFLTVEWICYAITIHKTFKLIKIEIRLFSLSAESFCTILLYNKLNYLLSSSLITLVYLLLPKYYLYLRICKNGWSCLNCLHNISFNFKEWYTVFFMYKAYVLRYIIMKIRLINSRQ